MMKCNKCGNPIPDDSEFCQYCGARIENTTSEQGTGDLKEKIKAKVFDTPASAPKKETPIITAVPVSAPADKPTAPRFIEADPETENASPDQGTTPAVGAADKTANAQKPEKKKKTRYCKNCGAMIDPGTKKYPVCSVAVKKRFCKNCGTEIPVGEKKCPNCHKTKKVSRVFGIALVVLLIAATVALSALCVYQRIRIDGLQEQNQKANSEIKTLKSLNDAFQKANDTLKKDNESLRERLVLRFDEYLRLQFYDEYVVVVSDDGTNLYHKYGCEDFDSGSFWVYSVKTARSKGYKACKKCIN